MERKLYVSYVQNMQNYEYHRDRSQRAKQTHKLWKR